MREGSGRVRDIPEASIGKRRGQEEGASGFVDAEFEGHAAGKLVSLVVRGDVGRVDPAFYVHLHVGGHVQELHGHQGLRVVHLGQRRRAKVQARGNSTSSPRTPLPLGSRQPGPPSGTYVELFAIVREVHEVNVAIGREHDKAAEILSIFISLWGRRRVGESMLGRQEPESSPDVPLFFLRPQIISVSDQFPLGCEPVCVCVCLSPPSDWEVLKGANDTESRPLHSHTEFLPLSQESVSGAEPRERTDK